MPLVLGGAGLAGLASAVWLARAFPRRRVWVGAVACAALPPLVAGAVASRLVPESYLRFGHPWLTPVGLVTALFVALRLSLADMRATTRRVLLGDALTALAVLALGFAVATPEIGLPLDRMTVVVVVDRSRSIELVPSAEERVRRELSVAEGRMREGDRIGRVVFAATAASEELPRPRDTASTSQRIELGREATDVGAGIRRALAELPADSSARIVVLSDGVATRGDAMAAAAAALAAEVPIDVVTLEQRSLSDVRLVAVRTASSAAESEPVALRVVVGAPKAMAVELRVKRDGVVVRRLRAEVDAGETALRIVEPSPGPGLHRFDVEVSAEDPRLDESAEDNARSTFVRVRGPARALVLDGDPGQTAFVAGALRGAAMLVDEGSLSSFPDDVAGMAAYDLLVVGDIPASAIAPERLEALGAYVSELGGGLWLLGGDRSFGPGGYARTPIEEVSPVSFDRKQDHRRASLAEVIAIDISGSMGATVGGRTKLDLANEAAARSAALLGAGDWLGVDHVDTVSHWTVPLAPVRDAKALESTIRLAGPGGGGIFVDVALEDAYSALAKAKVNLKHVLLFADGSDAENISPAVNARVSSALSSGITTSVVALGQGPDVPACEELSRRGKGRFYIVEDASRLPAVFTQETILASRSAIFEEPFRVVASSPHAVLRGVDVGQAPSLDGYVVTIPKPRADVVLSGPEGDPVLALWQAGLGHAGAFTSDLKARWGHAWTSWPGAAQLTAQVARQLARREDDQRVRLEADIASGELELRATVVDDDGRLASFRRLVAQVRGPQGFHRSLPLEAAGAGSYRARLPVDSPGAYVATLEDEVSGATVATAGAALGLGDELRPTGSDAAFLARLAEITGGKRRDTLAGIFDERGKRRFAYEDVSSRLLVLAAFAWLLAVAARRLAWLHEPRFQRSVGAAGSRVADGRPSSELRASNDAAPAALAIARDRRERRSERHSPPVVTPPDVRQESDLTDISRDGPLSARTPAGGSRGASSAVSSPGAPTTPSRQVREVPSPSASERPPGAPQVLADVPRAEPGRPLTAAEILLARRKNRR
ncbi:MAG: VWA domain-containing protein [Deltaproteobacteria bacterium]|nr:VWA domain-containing protein [Deltaproteobacteria bacterium]